MHVPHFAGLVIQEAWYGPSERGEDCESLDVNVTIPVQVLVSKSQLYIPGRRSKVRSLSIYLYIREEYSVSGLHPIFLRGVNIAGVISLTSHEFFTIWFISGKRKAGKTVITRSAFHFKSVASIRWRGINKTFRGYAAI